MTTPLKVRQISESEFTVQGHGVHTAFVETVRALEQRPDVTVQKNGFGKFDVTHIHTVGVYSLFFLLFGSGKKVISAHVVPASFVGSLVGAKHWLPLASLYLRWFYNRAQMILAVSDATKRELIALGVKRPIEITYNMIDTSVYATTDDDKRAARRELGISDTAWVVVGAGQVQPRKRVDSMIAAATTCPDIEFMWIGGMPFGKIASSSADMQAMMDHPPKNMSFPGIVPLEKIKLYYQAADAFFLPSDQETFGLVVVEAASAGLPVVLRDIPDYNETFRGQAIMTDESGFGAIFTKLRRDTKFYKDAQAKALALAQRYDSKASAQTLVRLYRRLV